MLKLSPCKQNSSTCFTLALAEECIRAEHDAAKSRETLKGIKIKTRPKNVRYFRIIRMLKLIFSQYRDCPALGPTQKAIHKLQYCSTCCNHTQIFLKIKRSVWLSPEICIKCPCWSAQIKKIDCPVFHQLWDQPKKLYTLAQHRNILYCAV